VCYSDGSAFALYAKDNSGSNSLKYSSEDAYIHYCYVINNYAKNFICIRFESNKYKCEESNIINNSQASSIWGTFFTYGITIINKCCLINNVANNKGALFSINSGGGGTMEVRECTIQSGYSISGAVTTSYSNTVAGSECAAITNCGTKNANKNEDRCRCSDWDIVLLHKIHLVWTILKYIKILCYNNIFITYTIIMCNICIIYRIYCTITQDTLNIAIV
jgi:hypothetical protein